MELTEQTSTFPKLSQNFLKDQVAAILRDHIVTGRIAPGTKLVEREVANLLNVSRAPARDALMQLEKEGLIVSKADARYVIDLTKNDILELYQVRLVLEKLAIENFIRALNPTRLASLTTVLEQMRRAVREANPELLAQSDLAFHRELWRGSENAHLENMLMSMFGAIFMFAAHNVQHFDPVVTLQLHERLVRDIAASDIPAALASMDAHMENSIERTLNILNNKSS